MSQGDADEDGDNRISEQEFVNVLSKPQATFGLTWINIGQHGLTWVNMG